MDHAGGATPEFQVLCQMSDVGCQLSDVRCQMSEIGYQTPDHQVRLVLGTETYLGQGASIKIAKQVAACHVSIYYSQDLLMVWIGFRLDLFVTICFRR